MQVSRLRMVPEVHFSFDTVPEGAVVNTAIDRATWDYAVECGIDDPLNRLPYESSHVPLYYMIVGLIASPFPHDPRTLLYLARMVSVLLGAATVFFCWRATRWLAPEKPTCALAAASAVLLMPQFNFNAATAGNDSAVNCASAAALAVWFQGLRQPGYDTWLLRAGTATGLAILAKLSGLALVPGLALVVVFRAWQVSESRDRWRRALRMGLGAAGMIVLIAGWWFLRNVIVYGDPTGLHDVNRFYRAHFSPFRPDRLSHWGLLLMISWGSFWGCFGWMDRPLPVGLYLGTVLVTSYLLTLTLITAVKRAIRGPRLSATARQALLVMVSVMATLIGLYLLYNLRVAFQAQGRYLFPAILPISLLLTWGLTTLTPQRDGNRVSLGIALLWVWLGLLNVAGLLQLNA
jgi:4-amino-4-deoxy-L-arabinose transferase-like glycosyltransferase